MARTCNIALIGHMFMGRTHSNAWLKVGKFFKLPILPAMHTVCAKASKDELNAFARQWGWQNYCTDFKYVVANDEIDLVDIGTPNNLHAEQSIAALEAGRHD